MTKKPSDPKKAAFLPCQPFSNRECRYVAKVNHVISAHVSLGSQLHYEPQASFAHTAPEIIPNVRKGNPKPIIR